LFRTADLRSSEKWAGTENIERTLGRCSRSCGGFPHGRVRVALCRSRLAARPPSRAPARAWPAPASARAHPVQVRSTRNAALARCVVVATRPWGAAGFRL